MLLNKVFIYKIFVKLLKKKYQMEKGVFISFIIHNIELSRSLVIERGVFTIATALILYLSAIVGKRSHSIP